MKITENSLHVSRRWVWTIALMAVALMMAAFGTALPSQALALQGDSSSATSDIESPAPPLKENSWRYSDGERRGAVDTDSGFIDPYGVAITADNYTRFTRSGTTWRGTLAGDPITITNANSFGVDVSEWNGEIDWDRAKRSGVEFAIIRCGYGSNNIHYDDDYFYENVHGCQKAGIPFGIYLYSYASNTDGAASEADHVLRLLSEAGLNEASVAYPIYYDLEELELADVANRQLFASMARTFCEKIEAAGYEPGVYSSLYWWNTFLTDPVFDRWERWVAQWPLVGSENASTSYKGDYGIWQCLSTGWVDGIGVVDVDFDYLPRYCVPAVDQTPGAVFRIYNPYSGEHLYTQSADEGRSLMVAGWRYEGRSWTAPTSGSPVYRLYNRYNGGHLYSTDANEYRALAGLGWTQEGVQFYSSAGRQVPIYRLYNPYVTVGTHLFTRDYGEYQKLHELGWRQEGVCCYGIS